MSIIWAVVGLVVLILMVRAAISAASASATLAMPGDRMPDGTIFVGISPTTHRPFYAMPHDLPDRLDWYAARRDASRQTFAGHDDWRLPTREELLALYRDSSLIGGFGENISYWSSTEIRPKWTDIAPPRIPERAWYHHFRKGGPGGAYMNSELHVRCVRDGKKKRTSLFD
jgi:hypothetical protein